MNVLSCRCLRTVEVNVDVVVSADPWHSVMQQMVEIVAEGALWRAASQHSAPHPPSPSRCGGITANELPIIVTMKRDVTSHLNIEINQSIYIRPFSIMSTKEETLADVAVKIWFTTSTSFANPVVARTISNRARDRDPKIQRPLAHYKERPGPDSKPLYLMKGRTNSSSFRGTVACDPDEIASVVMLRSDHNTPIDLSTTSWLGFSHDLLPYLGYDPAQIHRPDCQSYGRWFVPPGEMP